MMLQLFYFDKRIKTKTQKTELVDYCTTSTQPETFSKVAAPGAFNSTE
jgi:hypothetical protein